jgi:hydroxymethylpyrimidine/phosphomethylpyrimidine kinase
MINKPEVATLIKDVLVLQASKIPVILDPVMVATSGHRLIEPETVETLQRELFPLATLVTPNIDEAVILAKQKIGNVTEMIEAAHTIIAQGANAVLLKGGHLLGTTIYDVFVAKGQTPVVLESPYIHSANLHGTGCTLSSAIAAEMAKGNDLITAIQLAKTYIAGALQAGAGVKTGQGNGPLNHFFEPLKLIMK